MTKQYPAWMGKMRGLTPEEIMTFLAGPIVARVATVDEAGLPYVTPVWQEYAPRYAQAASAGRNAAVDGAAAAAGG